MNYPIQPAAFTPLDLANAPRDGRTLWLLVDYRDGDHALDDAECAWTIGHNNFDNDGEDYWNFAGWCWSQDCYTEGKGRVMAWANERTPASVVDTDALFALEDALATGIVAIRGEGMAIGAQAIDTNSDNFKAGALWALAECQRQHDAPEVYSAALEGAALGWADAERLMDEFDLVELRAIFDQGGPLSEADAQRIHALTDPTRADDGEATP